MKKLRVPDIFVGALADLSELFFAWAKRKGFGRQDAELILRLFPAPIQNLTCFLDRLTGLWRYEYGEPIDLPGGAPLFGTHMYQQADMLFDVLVRAQRLLSPDKFSKYIQRLANPEKHEDTLVEFAPVLRLNAWTELEYEAEGYAEGNKTIDWLIRTEEVSILIDVKNRTKDLLESLVRFQAGVRNPDGSMPDPTHDTMSLFRSLETKFRSRPATEFTQVAWIRTRLMQEEHELTAAFWELDASRVHAVLLGDFADDVYVLARDARVKQLVLTVLQSRESRRFVFQRGQP
jgi:hypothetical protein